MDCVVYARSDGALCRVTTSASSPEREARRLSRGQPFTVRVAARVAGVDGEALREALRSGEAGEDWYSTPLPDILRAIAQATRPGAPEELGAWQRWLEPCRPSLAPRAAEVKAALRERGAPPWLLPLCREVSQKDVTGHYRRILKLSKQTVRASAPYPPAPAAG
jgi:hypothetical protein